MRRRILASLAATLVLSACGLNQPTTSSGAKTTTWRPSGPPPADLSIGQNLFATTCATCHGPHGEGSDAAPTLNDGSVFQEFSSMSDLVRFIHENMPASNPGSLTEAQARAVADFIVYRLNKR
jgi:mono/diheme cytochrome c family protein